MTTNGRPSTSNGRTPVPAPAAMLFVATAVLVCITNGYALLNSDGDLARHIRVGTYMLKSRSIPHVDLFSHTMYGRPFIPYEWLSEILFAGAHAVAGLPGVTVFAALIIASMALLTYRFMADAGTDPLLSALTTGVAVVLTSLHWLARPHLFTMLCTAILMVLLVRAHRRGMVWCAILFVLWANLHGGFTYGLILIGLLVTGDFLEVQFGTGGAYWRGRLKYHAGMFAAGLAGTLVNPVGPRLHTHVLAYLHNRYLVDHTLEYMSPNFHRAGLQLFLIVLLGILLLLARNERRLSFTTLVVFVINTAFALYSSRNIPLFALTALPMIGMHLDADWRALRSAFLKRARSAIALGEQRGITLPWVAFSAIALIAIALNNGSIMGAPLTPKGFSEKEFPVRAVQRARAAGLTGRIFNEFTWGGYLLYAWPEQRVFIDGQTDFYGADLTRTHSMINSLDPGWRSTLDKWRISILIIQSRGKLAAEVVRDSSWKVWYRDKTAAIIVRRLE